MYSIFGETAYGVPNPMVPHWSPYPTRFHGPWYRALDSSPRHYRQTPTMVPMPWSGRPSWDLVPPPDPEQLGGLLAARGVHQRRSARPGWNQPPDPDHPPDPGFGETAPLFQSALGSPWLDAGVGAALGFAVAPEGDKMAAAVLGAAVSYFAGTIGVIGTAGVSALLRYRTMSA